MTAKRKATRKKATKKKPATKANWGANENPRHCRNVQCKSTNSTVENTRQFSHPPRTVRYRRCADCGQRYSTLEVAQK